MAVDTVWKRASASLYFPQVQTVWPAGTVDRQAAAWIYAGIAAGAAANPAYELFAANSDITRTLAWLSLLWPTLDKGSDVTPTLAGDSTI